MAAPGCAARTGANAWRPRPVESVQNVRFVRRFCTEIGDGSESSVQIGESGVNPMLGAWSLAAIFGLHLVRPRWFGGGG